MGTVQNYSRKTNLKRKDRCEDLVLDTEIILKGSQRRSVSPYIWVYLLKKRHRWCAFVKTVRELWVP
jgi:hypothetical protein